VKIAFVIINVALGIILLLLLLTMIDKREYAEIVIESPVFFRDVVLILCISVGPIILGGAIFTALRSELQEWFFPMILVISALLSGAVAYYCLPSVRQERLMHNVIAVERAIENLRDSRTHYQHNMDYYQHLMAELEMFHDWFDRQSKFLANASRLKDKRADRLSMFFGLLAVLFATNGARLLGRRWPKKTANPTLQWTNRAEGSP
jgi:hypothetical protein